MAKTKSGARGPGEVPADPPEEVAFLAEANAMVESRRPYPFEPALDDLPCSIREQYGDIPNALIRKVREAARRLLARAYYDFPTKTWREHLEEYRHDTGGRGMNIEAIDEVGNPYRQRVFMVGGPYRHPLLKAEVVLLDDAMAEIERFDPKTYLSASVTSADQSRRRGERRLDKTHGDQDKIANYLKQRDYKSSLDKNAIVQGAVQKFGVSEATVRNAAKRANLTRNYTRSKL